MTEPTEEQKARAREEARAVLARVLAGDDAPKRPRKRAAASLDTFNRPPTRSKSEAAMKYDHEEFKRLYLEEKMSSLQIAEKFDCNRKTVVKALIKMKVWEPAREGKGGRPLSDFCAKGHDQAVWRRESREGKADWHCGRCKLDREAEYRSERSKRRRDNRLDKKLPGVWELTLEGKLVGTVTGPDETIQLLDKKLRSLSRRHGIQHEEIVQDR